VDKTAIFTTLMGGMLAVMGGFLATYLSQYLAGKTEKRKLVREKIEELYTLSIEIKSKIYATTYFHKKIMFDINNIIGKEDYIHDNFSVVQEKIDRIEMIAIIYNLKKFREIMTYCQKVRGCIADITGAILNQQDIDKTFSNAYEKLEMAHKELLLSVGLNALEDGAPDFL
jgi:hypothetical protein